MGVDLGSVRIGVALSDFSGILAIPHMTLQRAENQKLDVDALLKIAEENEVSSIVVGIPNSLNEKNVQARESALDFVEVFRENTELDIQTIDERFTTVLAGKKLRESGLNSRTMKSKIDASAAAEILQAYLDTRAK